MRKMAWCRRAGVWVMMVTALLLGAGRAAAQAGADLKGEVVSVGIGGVTGSGGLYRPGSWVPVRVRLENRSGKPIVGRLGVQQPDLDGDKATSVGTKFILQPSAEARDFWLYYWPRPDDDGQGVSQVVVLDESGTQVMQTIGASSIKAAGVRINPEDSNKRSSRWALVLGPRAAGLENFIEALGGTEAVRFSVLPNANDLPDNVLGLDGVDAIIWEADWVKPSDVSPDFQLKAMLDWVKAGGHLIVTAGRQGEEFLKAGRLHDAMPMTFTGTREIDLMDLRGLNWVGDDFKGKAGKMNQLIGTLRPGPGGTPGARAISGGATGPFAEHPLAVTGAYGAGAITVLTVDASSPEMLQGLKNEGAIRFWSQVAGWQPGEPMTKAKSTEVLKEEENAVPGAGSKLVLDPSQAWLGRWISTRIDVTEVTQVRLLVAVLFLAVYWLAAGPIGYLVLRAYSVVHWSWWVFGGAVVVASGLAAGVVTLLHLTNYDLRHKSVVLGMVNSKDVTVLGYYGVFAPASGALTVEQAETGGMDYLAPLCEPTDAQVQPFADPQTYELTNEKPWAPAPVFRNTLKKMQGRWTGELPGVEGKAQLTGAVVSRTSPLTGELVNHSGYELENVELVLYASSSTGIGNSFLYKVKTGAKGEVWADGAKIDLAKMVLPESAKGADLPDMLELTVLQPLAKKYITSQTVASHFGGGLGGQDQDVKDLGGRGDDLLHVLLDERPPERLRESARVEMVRGLTRGMDATKLLHATGGLIIARAGDISSKRYVPSPVQITVNGRHVKGQGDVLFVWALPLASKQEDAPLGPEPGAGNGAGNGGARGRAGAGGGAGGPGAVEPE